MKPFSIINPYILLRQNKNLTAKPKHLPLAYKFIKPPINKPMLNPFTNLLNNSLENHLPNKWTLLWNLAKNYLNHNNNPTANLNNSTPAHQTNPNREPTNQEVATSTPYLYANGRIFRSA